MSTAIVVKTVDGVSSVPTSKPDTLSPINARITMAMGGRRTGKSIAPMVTQWIGFIVGIAIVRKIGSSIFDVAKSTISLVTGSLTSILKTTSTVMTMRCGSPPAPTNSSLAWKVTTGRVGSEIVDTVSRRQFTRARGLQGRRASGFG